MTGDTYILYRHLSTQYTAHRHGATVYMRPHFDIRIPLFLFPALLLTSNIFPTFCTANDTDRFSVNGDTAISSARHNEQLNKRQTSTQTPPNLTQCAKSCWAEFLKYCHTRVGEGIRPAKRERPRDVPGHHYSNNTDGSTLTPTFRKCMCSNPGGLVYLNSCSGRCNYKSMEKEGAPDQVVALEAWREGWCESHKATATIISTSPIPSESGGREILRGSAQEQGLSVINNEGQSGLATPMPNPTDDRDRGVAHIVILFVAGAASLIFISAFLLLGYTLLMRRNKYARRRGLFAWLRLKLLEHRGYHLGVGEESSGSPGLVGHKRAHATAMHVRTTNGRTTVVGNPKWLNKAMPPVPPQRSKRSESAREVVKEFLRDERDGSSGTWGLFRLRGIFGGDQPVSNVHQQRILGQTQDKRRSHRYSLGWITAASKYREEADEEDEEVQEYFRSKGIIRPVTSGNPGLNNSIGHEGTILYGDTPGRPVLAATYMQPGGVGTNISEVEKGYALESSDDTDEESGASSEYGGVTTVEEPSEGFGSDLVGRISPPQTDSIDPITQYPIQTADISDMPSQRGTQWNRLVGMEMSSLGTTGDLHPSSSNGPHENHGNADESFEEVDLSEGARGYDEYDWSMKPDSTANVNHDSGGMGHDPNLPNIEPGLRHNSDSDNSLKPKHRWRIGGKGSMGFRGLKRFGKRNAASGDSSDSGRGTYRIV